MCQYDAIGDADHGLGHRPAEQRRPFVATMPSERIAAERNPKVGEVKPVSPESRAINEMIRRSLAMDFEHADKAPADELNEIIWKSVKGWDSTLPPPPTAPNSPAAGQGEG